MYELKTQLPPLPEGYPISANIVLDSISDRGIRLVTFELEFPRYILAELATHRVLSRNSSSSRAIPTKKLIETSLKKFIEPVRYGKNQAGMQANKENLVGTELDEASRIWKEMAEFVSAGCLRLSELGLHKQWCSRPLEWFTTIRLVVTTTEFDNLFKLRDHHMAQDEICYLVQAMKTAMNNSTPEKLNPGQWHLPYISNNDLEKLGLENALKVSAARCARISYRVEHGVTSSLDDDLAMFNRLVPSNVHSKDDPFHASPTEHQATPDSEEILIDTPGVLHGNLRSWNQYRKFIEFEIPVDSY